MNGLLVRVDRPVFTGEWQGAGHPAHAGVPGSGPVGMTCGECLWSVRQEAADGRRCLKCNLTDWDGEPRTDIHASDPACSYFDPTLGSPGAPSV
jgi:hypothetical protein